MVKRLGIATVQTHLQTEAGLLSSAAGLKVAGDIDLETGHGGVKMNLSRADAYFVASYLESLPFCSGLPRMQRENPLFSIVAGPILGADCCHCVRRRQMLRRSKNDAFGLAEVEQGYHFVQTWGLGIRVDY